jgi:cortactin
MEERRREFFDEIKTQVRETRKGLDGFDIIDSDDEDGRKQHSTSQNDATYLSMSTIKPKVYTKRETTQEQIVSKFVKENDKIIHDETKRNVQRTSSCHGSSDDDDEANIEPTSIKHIDRELKTSPQPQTSALVAELKRKEQLAESPSKSSGLMARTLYDYQAAEEDELTFDVDELITNIEKLDKGWYKGIITRNGQKQVGLFPANYVKLLNDSSFY